LRQQFTSDITRSFQGLPGSISELAEEVRQSVRVPADEVAYKDAFFRSVGYQPHAMQREIHANPKRFALVRAGRRSGKSWSCAMEVSAMANLPRKNVWIAAAERDLCKRVFTEVWRILVNVCGYKPMPGSSYSLGILNLPNESTIACKTFENPQSLVGVGLHLLVIDEVQLCRRDYWEELLLPCVTGAGVKGRALLIGTPGPGHWTNDLFNDIESRQGTPEEDPDFQMFSAPSWVNPHWFPGGEDDPEIQLARRRMDPDAFLEQYAARPRRPRTQVFREWDEAIHVSPEAAFNPALDVLLGLDPGSSDGYGVVACQWDPARNRLYMIDEYQEQMVTGPDVWFELRQRPWWAKVKMGVCDDQALSERLLWSRPVSMGGAGVPLIAAGKQKNTNTEEEARAGISLFRRYLRDPEVYWAWAEQERERRALEMCGAPLAELDEAAVQELERSLESDTPSEVRRDAATLIVAPHCTTFREQIMAWRYRQPRSTDRNLKETPEKKNDHCIDACRYLLWALDPGHKRFGRRRAPQDQHPLRGAKGRTFRRPTLGLVA
jgi:hypothetical protein